jgi:hypothetical protein
MDVPSARIMVYSYNPELLVENGVDEAASSLLLELGKIRQQVPTYGTISKIPMKIDTFSGQGSPFGVHLPWPWRHHRTKGIARKPIPLQLLTLVRFCCELRWIRDLRGSVGQLSELYDLVLPYHFAT